MSTDQPKVRCPPYCRANCSIQHHPLLVGLLNCLDDLDEEEWTANVSKLSDAIKKYSTVTRDWTYRSEIPDQVVTYQYPPIHWACMLGRIKILEWLLSQNFSEIVQVRGTGNTGLHCACMRLLETCPNDAILKFRQMLPLMGKALLVKNHEGNTPLHTCCDLLFHDQQEKEYFHECISAILYYAKSWGESYVVRLLNARNNKGDTPLHLLVSNEKHFKTVKMLTEAGTSTVINNNKGKTVMDIAVDENQMNLAGYLVDVTAKRNQNITKNLPKSMIDMRPLYDDKGNMIGQIMKRVSHKKQKVDSSASSEKEGEPSRSGESSRTPTPEASPASSASTTTNTTELVKTDEETAATLITFLYSTDNDVRSRLEESVKKKKADFVNSLTGSTLSIRKTVAQIELAQMKKVKLQNELERYQDELKSLTEKESELLSNQTKVDTALHRAEECLKTLEERASHCEAALDALNSIA